MRLQGEKFKVENKPMAFLFIIVLVSLLLALFMLPFVRAVIPPVNDSLILNNPSGPQGLCLSQFNTAYIFLAQVTDPDGATNVEYVQITLDLGGQALQYRWYEINDSFVTVNDPSNFASLSSTSSDSESIGNTWYLFFKLTFSWAYPDENLHNVEVYTRDYQTLSDTDVYSAIYHVENDLTASSLTVDDYRVNALQSLTFSGSWLYENTGAPPPNGDYKVNVTRDGMIKGQDATLVNGQFSITGVQAESSVGSSMYLTEATYMTRAYAFNPVIVDSIYINITTSKGSPQESELTIISWTLKTTYDSTPISSFNINISKNSILWLQNYNGSSQSDSWDKTALEYNYTVSDLEDLSYGLTDWTTDSVLVHWYLGISSSTPPSYEEKPSTKEIITEKPSPLPNLGLWGIIGGVGLIAVGGIATGLSRSRRKPSHYSKSPSQSKAKYRVPPRSTSKKYYRRTS